MFKYKPGDIAIVENNHVYNTDCTKVYYLILGFFKKSGNSSIKDVNCYYIHNMYAKENYYINKDIIDDPVLSLNVKIIES